MGACGSRAGVEPAVFCSIAIEKPSPYAEGRRPVRAQVPAVGFGSGGEAAGPGERAVGKRRSSAIAIGSCRAVGAGRVVRLRFLRGAAVTAVCVRGGHPGLPFPAAASCVRTRVAVGLRLELSLAPFSAVTGRVGMAAALLRAGKKK